MPKESVSEQKKIDKLIREFVKDILSSDGSVLFCKVCNTKINHGKKYFVTQHFTSAKHKNGALKNVDGMKTCLLKNFNAISHRQSQFSLDLCEALIKANIPLWKLENPSFKQFLEKYTKERIPCESTLRKNYIDTVYTEVMEKIRNGVGEENIWVSIDETTDALGRYVANVIIGTLHPDTESKVYLLTTAVIESVNNTIISQLFLSALSLLWPEGVKHEKVLLFVTDAAPYMKAAGKVLQVVFPKMIHVTCIAHGLHRVAEEIRGLFRDVDLLISNVKKVFLKAPSRIQIFKELAPDLILPPQPILTRWGTWISAAVYYSTHYTQILEILNHLEDDAASIKISKEILAKKNLRSDLAYIHAHFCLFPDQIKSLEERNLTLVDQFKILDEAIKNINNAPGLKGDFIKEKCNKVFQNNSGVQKIRDIYLTLSGDVALSENLNSELNPLEMALYKYAPLTSVDVERSFSMYKNILSDKRQNVNFENLKKIINCNGEPIMLFITRCALKKKNLI